MNILLIRMIAITVFFLAFVPSVLAVEEGQTKLIQSNMTITEAQQRIEEGVGQAEIPLSIWQQMLPVNQYEILWESGTERAFTGSLLNEKREGVFVSSGCKIPVFSSAHKFKSGTGWPSFWDLFDEKNIILKEDMRYGMRRVEVLSRCGEHLGHLFKDGPEPTGLRYCINSLALEFIPAQPSSP